jgi:group I intron endonuclease
MFQYNCLVVYKFERIPLPINKTYKQMDTILLDASGVRGVIYCVEHITSGKKYVGQTRSHRLNHGRYRSHISEATCNTKHKSGHLLGVDIRQYGTESFCVSTLEVCDIDFLDDREIYWIESLNTIYPNGYNLSPGAHRPSALPVMPNPTVLATPRQRGGCISRSAETRAKMAERGKAFSNQQEVRIARSASANEQHTLQKIARFDGVSIDANNLDQYIFTKGKRVFVRVSAREASFTGVGTTQEENIKRAKEFLSSLTTATLPNCSGNP